MPVTLTSNYRQIFSPETLAEIDRLTEDAYSLSDILVFIDTYSEKDFVEFFEEYQELASDYGTEVLDFYVTNFGSFSTLEVFTKAYIGEFSTPERMAEDFCDHETAGLYYIVPDWEATADTLLDSDVVRYGDHYFESVYACSCYWR